MIAVDFELEIAEWRMWYFAGAIIVLASLVFGIKIAEYIRNRARMRCQERQKLARIRAMEEKLGDGKKIESLAAFTSSAPSKSASSGISR